MDKSIEEVEKILDEIQFDSLIKSYGFEHEELFTTVRRLFERFYRLGYYQGMEDFKIILDRVVDEHSTNSRK